MKARLHASEHDEQAALMRWAAFAVSRLPELALLHAIPNGGWRDVRTALRMQAEGVKPGVPDLCLPVARGGAHGLYIELKAIGGRPSGEQRAWIGALRRQGYRAEVCIGWEAARCLLETYLRTEADAGRLDALPLCPAHGGREHG